MESDDVVAESFNNGEFSGTYQVVENIDYRVAYISKYVGSDADVELSFPMTIDGKEFNIVVLEEGVFSGCSVDSVTFSVTGTAPMLSISEGAFEGVSNAQVTVSSIFSLDTIVSIIEEAARSNTLSFTNDAAENYDYQNGWLYVDETSLAYVSSWAEGAIPKAFDSVKIRSTTVGGSTVELGPFSNSTMTSVTLPNGMTKIPNYTFMGMASLESVTIPEGVTTIGISAFSNTGLTSIDMPDTVTTVESNAFYGCSELATIDLSGSLSDINNTAFMGCGSISDITVGGQTTFSSEYIEVENDAIYVEGESGTHLMTVASERDGTSFTVKDGTESIGQYAFTGSKLTSITLPDTITKLENERFQDCENLQSLEAPGVTEVSGSALLGCGALETLKLAQGCDTSDADLSETSLKVVTKGNDQYPVVNGSTVASSISWYDPTNLQPIDSVEDLREFASIVNSGIDDFAGKTVSLVAGETYNLAGEAWVPIGNGARGTDPTDISFAGTFEGNDATIAGLTGNGYKPSAGALDGNEYLFGFFGYLSGNATVSDLNFTGVDIDLGSTDTNGPIADSVAALAAYAYGNVKVSGITVGEGKIVGYDAVGGIVARSYGESITIENCSNAADVKATYTDGGKSGGIIGIISDSYVDTCTSSVTGCQSTGDSTAKFAGGIVGLDNASKGTHTVKGCTVTEATVKGTDMAGGIAARISTGVTLDSCTVTVSTISADGSTGGITGGNGGVGQTIAIRDCDVEGTGITSKTTAGGIIGSIMADFATVSGGSVNGCTISATDTTGDPKAGGIVGSTATDEDHSLNITIEDVKFGGSVTLSTGNQYSVSANGNSYYRNLVGAAVALLGGKGTITISGISETEVELIAHAGFEGTITLSRCTTSTVLDWMIQGVVPQVVLEGTYLAGLQVDTQIVKVSMDESSTIGQLIAGAANGRCDEIEQYLQLEGNSHPTGNIVLPEGTTTVGTAFVIPDTTRGDASTTDHRIYKGKITGVEGSVLVVQRTGEGKGYMNAGTYIWDAQDSAWDPQFQEFTDENLKWTYDYTDNTLAFDSVDGNSVTLSSNGGWSEFSSSAVTVTATESVTEIGENAFGNFNKMQSATFEGTISSVGTGAFSGCSALTYLSFGGDTSVDIFVDGTFSNCSQLKNVYVGGSVYTVNSQSGLMTSGSWSGGVIDSVEDLQAFAQLVNSGVDFAGQTVTLGESLDLSEIENWTPIGTTDHPFAGIFDGRGYTISGLTISKTDTQNEDLYLGLFGNVVGEVNEAFDEVSDIYELGDSSIDATVIAESNYTAVIKGLTLSGVKVNASGSFVAAVAGCAENVLISDVHVDSGVVTGTNSVGSIVGRGYDTVITGCSTGKDLSVGSGDNGADDGDVYNFGGIAGALRSADPGGEEHPSAVINTENSATLNVYLSTGGVGGIVGHSDGSPLILYGCENNGTITITGYGDVAKAYNVIAGGMAGLFQENSDNVIASCVNNGDVTTSSDVNTPAGALAGMANYYGGLIVDSVNNGDISGNAYYVAGFVGHGAEVVVDGCSNTGTITSLFALGGPASGDNTNKGYASTICAGTAEATYRNMTFSDVDDLLDAMVKVAKKANTLIDTGAMLHLENVTVSDPSGTLVLPDYINVLTSDTAVCTSITVNDRSVYEVTGGYNNTVMEIGVPNADVMLGSLTENGKLTVSADGMSIMVGDGKTVGSIILDSVDDITVTNLGVLGTVTVSENLRGGNVTVYNGTGEDSGATLEGISAVYASMTVHNYGSIVNENMSGGQYLLSVGRLNQPSDATFEFHNHSGAVMTGGRTDSTSNLSYMFHFSAASEIAMYFHEGSSFTNKSGDANTRWFTYYGLDGIAGTAETVTKGTLMFFCDEGTVLDRNNNQVQLSAEMWVGRNDGDAEVSFKQMFTVTVTVDGTNQVFDVEEGGVLDTSLIEIPAGFTMSDQQDSKLTSPVTEDVNVVLALALDEPAVDITVEGDISDGGPVTLTAVATHVATGVTYTYRWSTGSADRSRYH